MFRREMVEVEYQIWTSDDGYALYREGSQYDVIPFALVPNFIDNDTLIEAYLSGRFAYQTNNLPPNYQE